YEDRERNEEPSEIDGEILEKRKPDIIRNGSVLEKKIRGDAGEDELPNELPLSGQALRILSDDFFIVVDESDEAVRESEKKGDPDVRIRKIGPEQGRDRHPGQDQRATHRGGSLFRKVRLGTIVPDDLLHLLLLHECDEPGTQQHTEEDAGDSRPE